MQDRILSNYIIPSGIAAYAILTMYPYFIWGNAFIYKGFFILYCVVVGFNFIKKQSIEVSALVVFVMLVFWVAYAFFPRGENISFPSAGVISILLIPFLQRELLVRAFVIFRFMYVVILCCSILQYPLIVLGLVEPVGIIEPMGAVKISRGQFYIDHIFNIILNDQHLDMYGYSFFRMSSIFDEPGLIGTVSALLLFTYRDVLVSTKNKFEKVVLYISLFLSFSLGGYCLWFIGRMIDLFIFNRRAFFKNSVVFFTIVISALSVVASTEGGQKYIYDRVWNGSSISIKDNRASDEFDELYSKQKDDILTLLFGYGKDAHVMTGYDVSSYKGFIYNFGVIGVFFVLLIFSTWAFAYGNMNAFSMLVFMLVLINSYQRPIDFNYYYYFIIASVFNRGRYA